MKHYYGMKLACSAWNNNNIISTDFCVFSKVY